LIPPCTFPNLDDTSYGEGMGMAELRDTGSRYEMDEQGLTSYADYRRNGDRLWIDYVFAPPALRGTGASGRLMAAVAEDARAKGLKITPICGYAAAWLQRSEEFRGLVG
jgi:predicted GNAT family acetyltransferase